jgi:hypothetical protein
VTQTLNRRGMARGGRRGAEAPKQGDAMRERLTQRRASRTGRQIGFMDWALKVPEPKTGTLSFIAFPFQKELYLEGVHDKEGVVQKATQVGMSAWVMRWALYHADTRSRTGLYVFPTQKDMHDFSSLRVKPLVAGSKWLMSRKRPDDPDNKGMMGIGLGMMVFRGSESKRGLDSVDCDHIVFDEYDTLDHENIPDAEMRVSSPLSPGLIRRIGVPSVPDWGVNRMFNESDRRRWFVKCPGCGLRQQIDFFENVDLKRAIRVCSKPACRSSLEDVIGAGEWVAEFNESGRSRGYHVTRLIVPGANVGLVIAASKKRNPAERTVFFNKHLGVPWIAAENRLSREIIAAAQRQYTMDGSYLSDKLVTMGVDVGDTKACNVRISEHLEGDEEGKKRALWIGEVNRFFDHEAGPGPSLEGLMKQYGVHMCAIDYMPDGRMARLFAEKFWGRVYIVNFYSAKDLKGDPLAVDNDMMRATIHRTTAIDATFDAVRQQRNHLPQNLPEGYVEQLGSLVKVHEEDEFGKRAAVYRKIGEDDYAFAEVFDLAASELWLHRQLLGQLQGETIETLDDHVDIERSELASYTQPDDYYAGGKEDMSHWEQPDMRP